MRDLSHDAGRLMDVQASGFLDDLYDLPHAPIHASRGLLRDVSQDWKVVGIPPPQRGLVRLVPPASREPSVRGMPELSRFGRFRVELLAPRFRRQLYVLPLAARRAQQR